MATKKAIVASGESGVARFIIKPDKASSDKGGSFGVARCTPEQFSDLVSKALEQLAEQKIEVKGLKANIIFYV
jgi:hypothetical protein